MADFELYLSVHLLAAITWIGGSLLLQLLVERARVTGQSQHIGFLGEQGGWLGNRFFLGSAVVLIATGILMVADSPAYDFSQFWISYALAVLIGSFVLGAAFMGPQSKRLGELVARESHESAAVQAQQRKLLMAGRIELLFLLSVVVVMATKPGFP